MTSPTEALERLRAADASGTLDVLADRHGLALVVAFGSTVHGRQAPRDLDVAVAAREGRVDLVAVAGDLTGLDAVDLLDLDATGPVARQQALVAGEQLYEFPVGEFARQQLRASGERLSTEWLRRRYVRQAAAFVAALPD